MIILSLIKAWKTKVNQLEISFNRYSLNGNNLQANLVLKKICYIRINKLNLR